MTISRSDSSMAGRYPCERAGNGTAGRRRDTAPVPDKTEALTHEKLLAAGYDAFNRRDSERLRELMVPEFEWHEAEEVPGRKICRSADEFLAYMEGFDRLWEEFSFKLLDLTPGRSGAIVATVRGRGRGKATEDDFELEISHVWRFRDGHVARMDAFLDRRDALDAAGVR